ncbi:hypothetical protein EGJ57_04680 [Brucella anthropi]|uniref:hypothetical protein n=1 Tax=Brucella anthropi TaxID=529 RepID=UPI000F670FF3|nr:hypothetical protein [Brucella anthropi]RRY22067.1 hypothetical protein EGJ57_04680 [Brucella anthropi]
MTTLPEEAVQAAATALANYIGHGMTEKCVDKAKVALTAALPFLPVQVAVKKLEWREDICRKSFISDIGAVSYSVFWNDDAEWCDIPEPYDLIRGEDDGDTLGSFETADEAKAAAQADFEAHILSALEPSAARELALEEHLQAIEQQLVVNLGYFHDEKRILLETLQSHITTRIAAIRVLSSPDHADAGKVEGDGWKPTVCVGEMQTSAGADYYVCVKVGDREITPHMFKERWKAEYEVAEWQWLFNDGEKPDLLAYGPLPTPPSSEVA